MSIEQDIYDLKQKTGLLSTADLQGELDKISLSVDQALLREDSQTKQLTGIKDSVESLVSLIEAKQGLIDDVLYLLKQRLEKK